jgi:hypothetical protein
MNKHTLFLLVLWWLLHGSCSPANMSPRSQVVWRAPKMLSGSVACCALSASNSTWLRAHSGMGLWLRSGVSASSSLQQQLQLQHSAAMNRLVNWPYGRVTAALVFGLVVRSRVADVDATPQLAQAAASGSNTHMQGSCKQAPACRTAATYD